jgi:hypothetical protein
LVPKLIVLEVCTLQRISSYRKCSSSNSCSIAASAVPI